MSHSHAIASFLVLSAFALSGCAAPEKLTTKMVRPVDVTNLSGQWRLNEREGQNQDAVYTAITANNHSKSVSRFEEVTRTRSSTQSQPDGRPRNVLVIGNAGGALVHVFLNTAEKLKVTQTESALFISFNRAVVAEYTFGENRMISIGEVQAARASGWSGNSYIIETLDKDRRKLTERYSLSLDNRKLFREIILRDENMEEVSVAQVYDRVPN
jgi:hypothetical protein